MNSFALKNLAAALAVFTLLPAVSAPAVPEERWLFVFDTSTLMKKRLPAVEMEIKNIFSSNLEGRLHAGDSLGVWTFDKELHLGQFPLTVWAPENAVATATNLIAFLRRQHYAGETTFSALQPILNRVIQDSERLTVAIFCDGAGEIDWTPYNDGINDAIRSTLEERKKLRQPVVLLLRTQFGKFIGGTVNYPPTPLNVPPFPALPVEKKLLVTNAPVAVKPAPAPPPPLIIIGKSVSTNDSDIPLVSITNAVASNLPPTNIIAHLTNQPVTNAVAAHEEPVLKTNVVVSAPPADTAETNAAPAPVLNGDNDTRMLAYVGAGLLGAAIALVVVLMARSRRPRTSLITSSMTDYPPSRKK
jgi:hypothetical protein